MRRNRQYKKLRINPSPFLPLVVVSLLLFSAGKSVADNTAQLKEIGVSNGWKEFQIDVNPTSFSWCGNTDRLVVGRNNGVSLIDTKTKTTQEYKGGSSGKALCSVDGQLIVFPSVQGDKRKVVVIKTASWTVKEFQVSASENVQLSADGRYLFFGTSKEGLSALDTGSGRVETVARWGIESLPVLMTPGPWVSPRLGYFVAPPNWLSTPVVMSGGEKLRPVPLRQVARDEKEGDVKWIDDWVWTPNDTMLVTLNDRVLSGFLVTVHDLSAHKSKTSVVPIVGISYAGARIVRAVDNNVYIDAGSSDATGAVLLRMDLREEPFTPKIIFKNMFGVSVNANGMVARGRLSGTTLGKHINDVSNDPQERFVEVIVLDEKGNETRIKKYYWRPGHGPWEVLQDLALSSSGNAIAFSKHAVSDQGVGRAKQKKSIVILVRE